LRTSPAIPEVSTGGEALAGRAEMAIVLLLVLGGFWLRIFRLDLQSIWSDEGLSIYRASQSLSDIVALSQSGIHPPVYDSLLHFWIRLAGSYEFSTRYLSLFFGVLALTVLFQLGRLLLGRRGALLATLVAAAAPFLVYYSQETRMYAPALFCSLLSVLAAVRWMRSNGSRVWLACYFVSAAAAVYTHYYSWLVVASLNFFVVLWAGASGRTGRQRLVAWAAAQVTLGIAYIPWARVLINKYETYLTPGSNLDPLAALYQTMVSFGLSYSGGQAASTPGQIDVPGDHQRVVVMAAALALIAGFGVVSGIISRQRRGLAFQWAFLPAYLIIPVAGIIMLSLGKRDFAPRYLLFTAPAYYLLLGQGIDSLLDAGRNLQRTLGVLALLTVLGTSSLSLYNYYYDPTYWRDDLRGTVDFINSNSRNGDAIVLNAYYQKPSFEYYYRKESPVIGLPASTSPDWDRELAVLKDIASKHDRVWLVLWQTYFTDPQGQIQKYLDDNAIRFKITQFRGGSLVVGYLTHLPVSEVAPGEPIGMEMGRTVRLESYELSPGPVCVGKDMPFTLYWRALHPVSDSYTVFVHLLDESGKSWAEGDSQPSGGGFPTTAWPVGAVVSDERRIDIPSEAPPGRYFLEVGMYDIKTMKRLGEGDPEPFQANLGPFQVLPEGCEGQR